MTGTHEAASHIEVGDSPLRPTSGDLIVAVVRYPDSPPLIRVELSGASGWADLEVLTVTETRQLIAALQQAVDTAA